MGLRHARRTLIAMAAVALMAIAMGTPAAADPPRHDSLDLTTTYVDDSLCEFPVTVSVDGMATRKVFFDKDGIVWKNIITPTGPLLETWSANGTTLEINYRPVIQFDWTEAREIIITRRGLFAGVPIPGVGPLWIEAGQIRWYIESGEIISYSGLWPTLALNDPSGLMEVCDYLS